MKILGIDPGVTGGWALLDDRVLTECSDLEVTTIGTTKQIVPTYLATILKAYEPDAVVLEDNRANGQNGSKANFSMGLSMGIILGVASTLSHPIVRVRPIDWKRTLGIGSVKGGTATERKEASRQRALELWPNTDFFKRKKDHNRAEAALIAEWYRRT
jgi:hypothetical protein